MVDNFLVLALDTLVKAVASNLFVILLERGQILTGLGELAFLHTLTDVPMDKGTLGVHEVELVVQTSPGFSNGSGIGQHADRAVNRSQFATRNAHGLLVVDADLETSWAPFNEVEGCLSLEGSDSRVAVAGNDITTVEQSYSHVLAVAGIAHDHLVVRLKAWSKLVLAIGAIINEIRTLEGKVVDLEALVRGLLARDDWRIADQRVVNTRIRHQVGLELVQVDIQGTIETQAGGDGAHNLGNEAVEMLIIRAWDIKVATADVIHGLVINQEGAVRVFNGAVGGEDSIVRLDHRGGDTRSRVDSEL